MARCTSWRFVGVDVSPDDCLPVGKNRSIWKPCREKVSVKGERCELCEHSLIMCPSVPVRRALVNEEKVSAEALHALSSDSNTGVALIAEQRLAELEEQDDTSFDHLAALTPREVNASPNTSVWN